MSELDAAALDHFVPPAKLLPADLMDFGGKDAGRGEVVSVRLHPRLVAVMSRIIQLGRESSAMPKTMSDFVRLCVVRHLARLQDAGVPQNWDEVPLLRALKEEMELRQVADGFRLRIDTLRTSVATCRQVVAEHIAELEFDLAADCMHRYLAQVERYRAADQLMHTRLVRLIHQDAVLAECCRRLVNHGVDVRLPPLPED